MKKKMALSLILVLIIHISNIQIFAIPITHNVPLEVESIDISSFATEFVKNRYTIKKGNNDKWCGDDRLTFLTDGDGVDFVKVLVDDMEIALGDNYVIAGDNSIIKLQVEFLEALTTGPHNITIEYVDGTAEGTFIIEQANNPLTVNNLALTIGTAIICIVIIYLTSRLIKKNRKQNDRK